MTHGRYGGRSASKNKRDTRGNRAMYTPEVVTTEVPEAVNFFTGEIITAATPVAPVITERVPLHVCGEFRVAKGLLCPFCNNGYRAPELIRMQPCDSDKALRCGNCGWVCTL